MRCPASRRPGNAAEQGLFPAVTRFPRADHFIATAGGKGKVRADQCRGFDITEIRQDRIPRLDPGKDDCGA